MSLLGSFIDSRTLAAIAAAGSSSYAHGLPAAPDIVIVNENTTTNSTTNIKLAYKSDATNISIYNHGAGVTATLDAKAIVAHSIIR
ncbi:MAG TPA: hypothetical protein ENG87_05840 [Candidatus Pacearchaeota archaeon]|nr:hypothetical protein [Candidatus Pacearchaeota archaeon]